MIIEILKHGDVGLTMEEKITHLSQANFMAGVAAKIEQGKQVEW